ncbi:MAG: 2TM domain-containing protein [Rhodoluna sp.]|nr:2TM domain-containing protein [Rhodoluna sp.]
MAKEKATPVVDEESARLREWARKSLKKKRDFKQLVGVWFAVSAILTAVWALTGQGDYWPVWAIFGIGVAVLFTGLDAYGPGFKKEITEADIDAEIQRRMKRR